MKINIIGGGIGGLALAAALKQKHIIANVYEATPHFYSFGGGLILPPNSQRVLLALGLESGLKQYAVPLSDMQIRDVSGKLLYKSEQANVASHYGKGIQAIPRARLHHLLTALLDDGQLHSDHKLSQLSSTFTDVTASFENGVRVTSDVLVGADGRTSRVRELLFPECKLVSTGQMAFRGIANLEPDKEWQHSFVEFWDSGKRFTFFKQASGQTYWHAPIRMDGHFHYKGDLENARKMLLREYAHFPDQVRRLLEATPDFHSIELSDISPLPDWWYRRVVLLGDAAHATSPNLGQGAAQALEDAWQLAQDLTASSHVATALTSYQQQREAKANAVVARSRQMGFVGEAGGALRWLRNMTLAINPEFARRHIESFYA